MVLVGALEASGVEPLAIAGILLLSDRNVIELLVRTGALITSEEN